MVYIFVNTHPPAPKVTPCNSLDIHRLAPRSPIVAKPELSAFFRYDRKENAGKEDRSNVPAGSAREITAVSEEKSDDEIGSVSHWLRGLKAGDRSAVDAIWHRYYERVVQFAERKMKINPDRAVDGEDIAQLAMQRLCLNVSTGRYPDLDDREQLWDLLVVFTLNRIRKHLRACSTLKRSAAEADVLEFRRSQVFSDLRTPEAPTIMADMVQSWLDRLDLEDPSGQLRQIAIWCMEEISGSEISRILKKRKSFVLQQIRLIRLLWEDCEK
jgi:hypothetical protein